MDILRGDLLSSFWLYRTRIGVPLPRLRSISQSR
jgi:hypothetical protein